MAGRHPAALKPRDERAHPVVKAAIEEGYLDTGKPYTVYGFAGHDAANEGRLSVNRAGNHLGVSTPAWVTDSDGNPCWKDSKPGYTECQDPDAMHGVHFRVHSKNSARKHVLQQSGGDPAKLKFNPFARGERRVVDDDGHPI